MTESSSLPPRVFAVLGMHRSGTSWLAGSLQAAGLELGDVSTANSHNAKGNRESPVLTDVHEQVLRANDGSWKRPRWPNRWPAEQSAALEAHVAAMARAGRDWGFKDPRALFLLDEWSRVVPQGLVRVGIYRHPLSVHRSLHARNPRFHPRRSLRLWRAYNERLVQEHRRDPFPLLRFDVAPAALAVKLTGVLESLELRSDGPGSFFDDGLVHNNDDGGQPRVPWRCRALWRYLEEHVA